MCPRRGGRPSDKLKAHVGVGNGLRSVGRSLPLEVKVGMPCGVVEGREVPSSGRIVHVDRTVVVNHHLPQKTQGRYLGIWKAMIKLLIIDD